MTRLIPRRTARLLPHFVAVTLGLGVLFLSTSAADATFAPTACLAEKRAAWVNLRKCQGTEQVKQLKGKPTDFAKCQTKFQAKFATITAKATKAAIACHYGANGDGTVTDYDTGLQWEIKNGEVGGVCLIFADRPNHCVNAIYSLADAQNFVNSLNGGSSTDGFILPAAFAGSADWRLPTVVELRAIVDTTATGCLSGTPCINPIFGPTVADGYWSTTTSGASSYAFNIFFDNGETGLYSKSKPYAVRAVRGGF